MAYTTFSQTKNDQLLEPMFFGQPVNVARYDQQKYDIFEKLIEKQLSFFWRPEEVDVSRDRIDYQALPELEKHMDSADAIGEIGLDSRIADRVPIEIQKTLFETQLGMAATRGLPVVIHCVGEWGALYDILRDFTKNRGLKKFLIHAASCSAQMAVQFEKIGARFSFGIRELSSKRGAECARAASPERILTETDGECSAESLENAAAALAALRGVSAAEIADAAFENFHSFNSK